MKEPKDHGFIYELKRDWATLRSLRGKELLHYIWVYYKVPIFLALVVLFSLYNVGHIIWEGQRPCRLRVCVVLDSDVNCRGWFDGFTAELKSDGQPGDVDINLDQPFDYDNMYYNVMEMEVMTTVASQRMDVAVCGEDMYRYLLAINACLPLDESLPEELLQRIGHRLIADTANLQYDETGQVAWENGIDGFFALDLEGTAFEEQYNVPDRFGEEPGPLYAVIISNTEHLDDSIALLEALTETKGN